MNRMQNPKLFQCVANSVTDCKRMFSKQSEHNLHFAWEHAQKLGFKIISNSRDLEFVCNLDECTIKNRVKFLSISLMVRHYIFSHQSIFQICKELESNLEIVNPWQVTHPSSTNSPLLFNLFLNKLLTWNEEKIKKTFDREYKLICEQMEMGLFKSNHSVQSLSK